jgi:hypothetical protein
LLLATGCRSISPITAGFFFCFLFGDCEKDTMLARNCCEREDGNTQVKALSHLQQLRSTPIPFLNGLKSNVIFLMLIDHTLANGQNT